MDDVKRKVSSPNSADCDQGVVHAHQVAVSPWDCRRLLGGQLAIGLGVGAAVYADEDRVQVDPGPIEALRDGREVPAFRPLLKGQTTLEVWLPG